MFGAAYSTSLEVLGTQPAVLGETREHPRAQFLPVMECEDHVRPTRTSEHLVRAGLALDGPTDAKKCGENEASSSAGPVAHAALKEMLRKLLPASSCSRRSATTRSARA